MASPSVNQKAGAVLGRAADITVPLPFTPRSISFAVDNSGAGEFGFKTDQMAGSAYISTSSGTDAGVTIGDRSFTIANGADVNVAAANIYYLASE